MAPDPLDSIKAGTGWIDVQAVSEADVVLTFKGYAPILRVKVIKSGLVKQIYISSKSMATALEEMRKKNNGNFIGIKFRFRKESDEKMAPYIVESIESI